MIGFRRVVNPFLTSPRLSLAVSLLSLIPILHLPNHSFVLLTNAFIFPPLRPFFDLHWPPPLQPSHPSRTVTHALMMLNTYAVCKRRPLTRYHREKKIKQTKSNNHYRRLSAGVRVIYLYYALVLSIYLSTFDSVTQSDRCDVWLS